MRQRLLGSVNADNYRRALELIYVLVNAENVRPLVREMTNFLTVADHELRPDLTAKICAVAERYAPSAKWRVDTVLRVMALPGNHISERIQASLIGLIAATPELHTYAVGKLYLALTNEPKQQVCAPSLPGSQQASGFDVRRV